MPTLTAADGLTVRYEEQTSLVREPATVPQTVRHGTTTTSFQTTDYSYLLTSAVLLLRASSIDADTFTPGDDWPNEGTGGSALDAVADGTPVLATSPEQGFVTADGSSGTAGSASPYYYVPHSALLDPGTGSFTAFNRMLWTIEETGGNDNIMTKITSDPPIGAGGSGWTFFDSTFTGGVTFAVADEGSSFGTNPAFAADNANLEPGEHWLVAKVDRDDDDTISLFVDGVLAGTGDASGVADIAAVHELIFGRGAEQTVRAYAYWDRALTDTEILSYLPAALGL